MTTNATTDLVATRDSRLAASDVTPIPDDVAASEHDRRVHPATDSPPTPHHQPGRVLVARVKSALEQNPYFRGRLRHIHVQSEDNRTVVLTGRLPSFYLSQILQTVVQQVEGVESLSNRVEVDR